MKGKKTEVKPLKIFRREAFLIRLDDLETEHVSLADRMFTHRFYDEKACGKCDVYKEDRRHDEEVCDNCAAYKGPVKLSKVIRVGETDLLSLPVGNRIGVKRFIKRIGYGDNYIVKSLNPTKVAFRRPIRFSGKLRSFQDEALSVVMKKKRGVIEAPARSGKTVVGAAIACKVGQKTMILAHQREWLINFQETFLGSETQSKFTNARPSQVRFCKTLEDFEKTDVCLVTPQQFMNANGKKMMKSIRNMFGVLIFDECHQASATQTARVVSQINTQYKIGLTATPDRKDCVAKGTLVLTNKGQVPVELLKEGDLVFSFNAKSGINEFQPIQKAWTVHKKRKIRITLEDGTTLVTTDNSYVFDPEREEFVSVQSLVVGQSLSVQKD